MKRLLAILPPVLVLIALVIAAEQYLRWRQVPAYLVPTPSAIWDAMRDHWPDLRAALWQTAAATLIGFGVAGGGGIVIAIVLSSAKIVRRAFYPYTVFFQTVPVVAIAPLLVIWFGPGRQSVAICATVVAIFPVITNTLAGLLSTDPALRDLFRLYRAGPIARLLKLRLPWALPSILTGLRIAAGLAVIGAIVGEFAAGALDDPGLGIVMLTQVKEGNTDHVFAAVLMASLLGLAILSVLNLASYLLLRHWHASERE